MLCLARDLWLCGYATTWLPNEAITTFTIIVAMCTSRTDEVKWLYSEEIAFIVKCQCMERKE